MLGNRSTRNVAFFLLLPIVLLAMFTLANRTHAQDVGGSSNSSGEASTDQSPSTDTTPPNTGDTAIAPTSDFSSDVQQGQANADSQAQLSIVGNEAQSAGGVSTTPYSGTTIDSTPVVDTSEEATAIVDNNVSIDAVPLDLSVTTDVPVANNLSSSDIQTIDQSGPTTDATSPVSSDTGIPTDISTQGQNSTDSSGSSGNGSAQPSDSATPDASTGGGGTDTGAAGVGAEGAAQ